MGSWKDHLLGIISTFSERHFAFSYLFRLFGSLGWSFGCFEIFKVGSVAVSRRAFFENFAEVDDYGY